MKVGSIVRFKPNYQRLSDKYVISDIKAISAIKHDRNFRSLIQNLQPSKLAYQDDDVIAEIKPPGSKDKGIWTPLKALELA